MSFPGLRAILSGLRGKRNEDFFLERIDKEKIPKHVAVIMDGNGRWAAQRGLPRIAGHAAGTEAVRRTIKAASEMGVRFLTLYTFSSENWKRPPEEVKALMRLINQKLETELPELDQRGVRVRVIGGLSGMPDFLQKGFLEAMELTADNLGLTLVIALNYGARTEITSAARSIAEKIKRGDMRIEDVNEASFAAHLFTADMPDPELLIRTSGEMRLSNFLLWQVAYAELWVTPVLWPDFTRKHLLQAVYDFQQRHRRYGGVDDL